MDYIGHWMTYPKFCSLRWQMFRWPGPLVPLPSPPSQLGLFAGVGPVAAKVGACVASEIKKKRRNELDKLWHGHFLHDKITLMTNHTESSRPPKIENVLFSDCDLL